jgi:prepilin signal peptidase PulO-like enzyme (type II secretory pathway)
MSYPVSYPMPLSLLLLSLLAGWLVNLAADTLPMRRNLRQTWYWPFCTMARLLPRGMRLALASDASLLHPRRSLVVWASALALGWLAYQFTGGGLLTFMLASQAWFFLAIAVIDLEHRRVLNLMLLGALPFVLLGHLFTDSPTFANALLAGALGFALFGVMAVALSGGMGMGDAKLAGVIGLMLGLSATWFALFVGVMAGGLASLIILLRNRFRRRQTMAYAPYLVLGTWVALYWTALH